MIKKTFIKTQVRTLLLLAFIYITASLSAQQVLSEKDTEHFKKQELKLQALQKKIYSTKNDSLKMVLNKNFLELWDTTLSAELSFSFPFDSLNQVGRLVSPDKNFRIINWNIPKSDGTHLYFGFIQTYDKKTKKYNVEKLIDKSGTVKNPETYIGTPEKWFGMLYYDVIKTDDYYTLLAWDGNDKLTTRKYIDILYFKDNGDAVFGKDVFKMPQKNPRRIVFEYSSELVMSLKYIDERGMIVFDHLAPKDEYMVGQFQFYGPDFSYDAYDFTKGKWKFIPDVDVKNNRNKNDNVKKNDNRKEKPVYVPH